MKPISLSLLLLFLGYAAGAQSAHDQLRAGDKAYKTQDYKGAEEAYRKALEKKPSTQGTYNLGSAIYEQQRFDEAQQQFESAAGQAKDPAVRADAYYNLGNTYFSKQKYKEAIDSYKNALRLQPDDDATQYNLSQALRQLQLQQQQQQQQQQDQEQQNQDQEQKDQNSPDQPQQQEGDPPPDQQDENQDQSEQQQPSNPQQHTEVSKEEAERLLDIMDREEQKVQEKMRKKEGKPVHPEKDW
ncbi:MAG: tetratricopeptide repeat protein [Lewinellaceae bacterium]|nr:tetratricopeptide repeat protein [Lewinellaceae bacterium]